MSEYPKMRTWQEKIAVMQAFANDRKPIQYRYRYSENSPWRDIAIPGFNWADYDYRVKPQEPRKLWVAFPADGRIHNGWSFTTSEQADVFMAANAGWSLHEYVIKE